MNENKILVLDIETTGFLKQGGSIVEIGIVDLDLTTGEISEVFSSLLREDILTAKHHEEPYGWIFRNSDLTTEDVREAPEASGVLAIVQDILNSYPLGCTAFNNKFDFDFLEDRGLRVTKLPCPMLLSTDICKLKGKFGKYKWPKVEEAFNFFFPDTEYIEQHRGLDDSKHEAMIVYELYKRGVFKMPVVEKYDSTEATLDHIATVRNHGDMVIEVLMKRYREHDRSKLQAPEKEVFDEYTPKLKGSTYGSAEYKGFLKGMGVALDHHYENNDHHPEHSKKIYCGNCDTDWSIDEEDILKTGCPVCGSDEVKVVGDMSAMSLLSLIEMLTDWKSATMQHDDGDIMRSIQLNQDRFGYSDELKQIFQNTITEMGWE